MFEIREREHRLKFLLVYVIQRTFKVGLDVEESKHTWMLFCSCKGGYEEPDFILDLIETRTVDVIILHVCTNAHDSRW